MPVDAAGATSTVVVAPTSSTNVVRVLAEDDAFVKSLPDKRRYRALTLSNSLTVLLASDPDADVEAGSVHVRAGHFDDPLHRPGLAHFHEHMLFLGTAKASFLGRSTSSSTSDGCSTNVRRRT